MFHSEGGGFSSWKNTFRKNSNMETKQKQKPGMRTRRLTRNLLWLKIINTRIDWYHGSQEKREF